MSSFFVIKAELEGKIPGFIANLPPAEGRDEQVHFLPKYHRDSASVLLEPTKAVVPKDGLLVLSLPHPFRLMP